jgi:CHRD domain
MRKLLTSLTLLLLSSVCFATTLTYTAVLKGPPESTSTGTGSATVTVNDVTNLMTVDVIFSGLEAGTTASHIHCCTTTAGSGSAGVATTLPYFVGFPIGVTSGTYNGTLDLTASGSYNPAFITANGGTTAGAEAALLAGMAADKSYVNIHTTMFPGGEISGFLTLAPEPSSFSLLFAAIPGALLLRRRRK